MLIKSLRMENFRQFKGTTRVEFSCDPAKNVTIILGDNTYGKTTLLQAFNWCLYGKVNFDQNPDFLLNYEVAGEMRNGDRQIVEVEITVFHDGIEYIITRSQRYTCAGNNVKGESVPTIKVSYKQGEPIIDPEVFDKVQEMIKNRPSPRKRTYSRHPFAGKLICGDCGSVFGHKVWRVRSTGERYDVWYCNHKFDNEKRCGTRRLRENEVKEAFTKMLEKRGELDTTYRDERWSEMVERVIVLDSGQLDFHLNDGQIVRLKP